MSQTAYQQDPNVAVEGMLADASFDKDIITAVANEDISFGLGVTREAGADDDRPPRASLPTTTAQITTGVFLGMALNDTTKEQALVPIGYATDDVMRVLRAGRAWVLAETVVALGDAAFVRRASGQLGAWRNDADTGDAARVPGASFRSATAGTDELAIVELKGHVT